ncbi:phosphoribosyl-AMP cyclohydrolase [Neisseriaceae bacterium ESL0693]|nr:phosphoribosyl-AMP cyclohydrolase [Neisseriaceae bacterium ESL0693]
MVDQAVLEAVKWNENGLVCAVVQDKDSLQVLMVAWLNAEALQETLLTGFAHYYSRSRQKQWLKGEESGHKQKIHAIRLDCDGDALVFLVEQEGGIACHTGHQSCFYRCYQQGQWMETEKVIKTETDIYGRADSHHV